MRSNVLDKTLVEEVVDLMRLDMDSFPCVAQTHSKPTGKGLYKSQIVSKGETSTLNGSKKEMGEVSPPNIPIKRRFLVWKRSFRQQRHQDSPLIAKRQLGELLSSQIRDISLIGGRGPKVNLIGHLQLSCTTFIKEALKDIIRQHASPQETSHYK